MRRLPQRHRYSQTFRSVRSGQSWSVFGFVCSIAVLLLWHRMAMPADAIVYQSTPSWYHWLTFRLPFKPNRRALPLVSPWLRECKQHGVWRAVGLKSRHDECESRERMSADPTMPKLRAGSVVQGSEVGMKFKQGCRTALLA